MSLRFALTGGSGWGIIGRSMGSAGHNTIDRSQPVNTPDRILDVAAECFLVEGYGNSRMTDIAQRAEVSRAALYKYFPNKESLLIALNERVIDDAREHGVKRLLEKGPAATRIANWLRDSLLSQWRHNAVKVVVREENQGILTTDSIATQAILSSVAKALESAIRHGIKSGEFRADLKPQAVAYSIQSLLLGLHRNNVSQRPILEIRDDKHIDTVVEIIVGGLKA